MNNNELFKKIQITIAAANSQFGAWNNDWEDAFRLIGNLFDHVVNGGLPPNVPPRTYIALGNGGPVSYTLLAHPKGATFTRWEFCKKTGQMEEVHRFECPT